VTASLKRFSTRNAKLKKKKARRRRKKLKKQLSHF
jgi:hypothetical protein